MLCKRQLDSEPVVVDDALAKVFIELFDSRRQLVIRQENAISLALETDLIAVQVVTFGDLEAGVEIGRALGGQVKPEGLIGVEELLLTLYPAQQFLQ